MGQTNLNSLSVNDITKENQSIEKAIHGIGTESYVTMGKLLNMSTAFDTLGEKAKEQASTYHMLVLGINDVEKSLTKLNQQLIAGDISSSAFLDKGHALAEELASLKYEITEISYDFSNELFKEIEDSKINDTINKYQGYLAQLSSLYTSYQKDKQTIEQQLGQAKYENEKEKVKLLNESLQVLEKQYAESLKKIAVENNDKLKVILGDLKNLSKSALEQGIEELDKEIFNLEGKVLAGDATEGEVQLIKQLVSAKEEAQKTITKLEELNETPLDKITGYLKNLTAEQLGKDLKNISDALNTVGEAVSTFDSAVGGTISTVGAMVGGVAGIATGISTIGTDPVGGASKIIQGAAGIVKAIGSRIEENKKIRNDYLKYENDLYIKGLEYNKLLRDRRKIVQESGQDYREYYDKSKNTINDRKSENQTEQDALLAKLQEETYVEGKKYKHGTWFRKAKTWTEYGSLENANYDKLEELNALGKLEGNAKSLFDQLKKLKEEGKSLEEELKTLEEERKQAWTGTTQSTVFDNIIEGFKNGKKSAKDFADDFEGMMKTAMMQALKMKFLEKELDGWYKNFVDKTESDGELTAEEISKLEEEYNKIIDGFAEKVKAMESVSGLSFDKSSEPASVAQRGLAAMSQDSATELNGSFNLLKVHSYNIDQNIGKIYSDLTGAVNKWEQISQNTSYCRRLENIQEDMNKMRNDISSIALKGIRLLN